MARYDLELFADYCQFYLQDEVADGDLSNSWTKEASDRMLAISSGVIGIGTVRNMDVVVAIEVLNDEPTRDFEGFDHVVECAMSVKGASIVAAGCTDYFPDALRIAIQPGTYRVRVSYANLDSLSADGLDGNDNYRVQLWPASYVDPYILKQRAV